MNKFETLKELHKISKYPKVLLELIFEYLPSYDFLPNDEKVKFIMNSIKYICYYIHYNDDGNRNASLAVEIKKEYILAWNKLNNNSGLKMSVSDKQMEELQKEIEFWDINTFMPFKNKQGIIIYVFKYGTGQYINLIYANNLTISEIYKEIFNCSYLELWFRIKRINFKYNNNDIYVFVGLKKW